MKLFIEQQVKCLLLGQTEIPFENNSDLIAVLYGTPFVTQWNFMLKAGSRYKQTSFFKGFTKQNTANPVKTQCLRTKKIFCLIPVIV